MNLIKDEPAGAGALLMAVYAALIVVWRVASGEPDAVLDLDVVGPGVSAVILLIVRHVVTPLSRPRDREGRALRPAQQPPATRAGA